MNKIDGKHLSTEIYTDLEKKIKEIKNQYNVVPGLSIVLIGSNADSVIYVNMKKKACKKLGIHSEIVKFSENTKQEKVIKCIDNLNKSNKIHGIIIQLPLPKHLDEFKILSLIDIHKDVDGFHQTNMYKLLLNQSPLFFPCTPDGCLYILKKMEVEISGKNIVLIGTSRIVGLPLALMLMHNEATVTLCHIKTKNIKEHTRNADILIVACGQAEMVKKDWIKKDVIILDVGINRIMKDNTYKIVGDVDYEDVKDTVSAITPVPGGIGPMTVAMLMKHTVDAVLEKYKNLEIKVNLVE